MWEKYHNGELNQQPLDHISTSWQLSYGSATVIDSGNVFYIHQYFLRVSKRPRLCMFEGPVCSTSRRRREKSTVWELCTCLTMFCVLRVFWWCVRCSQRPPTPTLCVFEGPVCASSRRWRRQATIKSRGGGPTLLPSFESCGCFVSVHRTLFALPSKFFQN